MNREDQIELETERFWSALDADRTLTGLRRLLGSTLVELDLDSEHGTRSWWIAPGERVQTCEVCERVLYQDEEECACAWHAHEEAEDATVKMELAA